MRSSTDSLSLNGRLGSPVPSLALDPIVLGAVQDQLSKLRTLADAEKVASDLPVALGPALERAPGVPELRELVSAYVQHWRSTPSAAGTLSLSTLTQCTEWEGLLQSCAGAVTQAQRTLLEAPPMAREEANVLSFDPEDGSLFRELDATRLLRIDDYDSLLADEDPRGRCSDPCVERVDPALELLQRVRAYAREQRHRLPTPTPALSHLTSGTTMESVSPDSDATALEADSPRDGHASSADFLAHLARLMHRHPDVVWQCGEWALLVTLLAVALDDEPDAALDVAERYFVGAGPRQRLLLLHEFVRTTAAATGAAGEKGDGGHVRTLQVVHRLALELPADWVALLDTEIASLLLPLLQDVILPNAARFSEMDPQALWLRRWCERASFGVVVSAALATASAPSLAAQLEAALPRVGETAEAGVHSHIVSVVACLLSCLPASEWDADHGSDLRDLGAHLLRLLCQADLSPGMMERVGVCVTKSAPLFAIRLPSDVYHATTIAGVASTTFVMSEAASDPSEASARRLEWHLSVLRGLLQRFPTEASAMAVSAPRADGGDGDTIGSELCGALAGLYAATERLYRSPGVPPVFAESAQNLCAAFWSEVVPARLELCRGVVDAIAQRAVEAAPDTSTTRLLVAISSSLEGWFSLRGTVAAGKSALSYSDVLDVILADDLRDAASALRARTCELLMRWCTVRSAREGLRRALHRRLLEVGAPQFYDAADVGVAPLLLPCELLDGAGQAAGVFVSDDSFSPVAMELPAHCRAQLREAALLQQVGLLLGIAHLPSDDGAGIQFGDDEFIAQVFRQVERDHLPVESAEVQADISPSTQHAGAPSAQPGASCDGSRKSGVGHTFGDDSLLALLAAAALSVLVSVDVEQWLWRSPPESLPRLRRLRGLCAARRGVDPVYFIARFLTSGGKGRRRLAPIFVSGFAAELQVDTTIPVEAFLDGEDYPPQTPTPAHPDGSHDVDALAVARIAYGDAVDDGGGGAVARAVADLRLAHPSVGAEELAALLQRQSLADWCAMEDWASRAEAVARRMLSGEAGEQSALAIAVLADAGVDLYFISYVCVASWMRTPPVMGPGGAAGGGLLRSSLKEFMKRGLDAWDALVARSLLQFVLGVARDAAEVAGATAPLLPPSVAYPVPSVTLATLLVRPFALERPRGERGIRSA